MKDTFEQILFSVVGIILFLAWATAFYTSLKNGYVLLGLIDLFIPPIGVLHGLGIWIVELTRVIS